MARIVIVEDEDTIAQSLSCTLREAGYQVDVFSSGQMAARSILTDRPQMVVLDIALPGMDGLEICRLIRRTDSLTPILMLTGRSDETDRITGLEAGADDYVTKPFSMREVEIRIHGMLRRSGALGRSWSGPISVGPFMLDAHAGKFFIDGKEISVTRKQIDLLAELMANRGSIVLRDELLTRVWGPHLGDAKTLDVHIRWLREKIEPDPSHPRYLITVRGRGYRFDVEAVHEPA